jgi:hypothetical protein
MSSVRLFQASLDSRPEALENLVVRHAFVAIRLGQSAPDVLNLPMMQLEIGIDGFIDDGAPVPVERRSQLVHGGTLCGWDTKRNGFLAQTSFL